MKNLLLSIVLLIAFSNINYSQNFWSPADSPGNGNIQVFAINSQGHIYGGSFDGLFRSTDNGDSWEQLGPETFADYPAVSALTINSMNHIYAATTQGILLKSTDEGSSWTDITGTLSGVGLRSLAVDASDNVYTGTNGGIYKSTNGGSSWELLTGIPDFTAIIDIVIDDNGDIFAGTSNGVYHSTDGGTSWTDISNGLPASTEINSLALGPSNGKNNVSQLYAASVGLGIYKFDQATQTWLTFVTGLTSLFVYSLAVNDLGNIYAGTDIGLFVYLVNATAWTLVNIPSLTTAFIAAIIINNLGYIFIGEDWGGVHRSIDGGLTWLKASFLLTAYSIHMMYYSAVLQTLFIGTDAGFWYKTLGQQWTQIIGPTPFFSPRVMVATAAYLFVGTFSGMWKMNWSTREWTQITNGLTSFFITSIVITSLGHLFVGTFDGVFRSIDNGANWERLVVGLTSLFVTSLVLHPAGYLLAATSVSGIFRMDLNSLTWTEINVGITNLLATYLAISPTGVLFAATFGGGVFRSTDIGTTWLAVIAGLTFLEIQRLVYRRAFTEASGELYAISVPTVFKSTDDGDTWSEEVSGLNGNRVSSAAADSSGNIFAGSIGGGIYQNGTVTSVRQFNNDIPTDYLLSQNYPNPFNPSTTFKFSISESGFTELKIYNTLGEVVETLVNKNLPAGNYNFNWNAADLPSGVYFYRLNSGKFNLTKKALLLK